MMTQNIVITMAGRSSRFYEAGYAVPKYQIMAHGHSLFYWSMLSLKNFLKRDTRLVFVCLADNDSSDYVRAECSTLGLSDVQIVELPTITDGQATSAYASRAFWQLDAPLLIYNIDTYVHPRALQPEQIRDGSDGWIPCFRVPGDHWSFVQLGDDEWATKVVEKNRISDDASIGLYWFARAGDFVCAYEEFFSNPASLVKGERYIAPLYQNFIQHHKKISITDLPVPDVHVLGTPMELDIFLSKSQADIL
jgi:hypothetical protein